MIECINREGRAGLLVNQIVSACPDRVHRSLTNAKAHRILVKGGVPLRRLHVHVVWAGESAERVQNESRTSDSDSNSISSSDSKSGWLGSRYGSNPDMNCLHAPPTGLIHHPVSSLGLVLDRGRRPCKKPGGGKRRSAQGRKHKGRPLIKIRIKANRQERRCKASS